MKLFDFVDAAFYVSLEHRTDRREILEKHLCDLGISEYVTGVQAIYPVDLIKNRVSHIPPEMRYKYHGNDLAVVCCWFSQYMVIREAKRMGLSNVLVLEDDAQFYSCEQYNGIDVIKSALKDAKSIPDWDVIYLGTSPRIKGEPEFVSPNLVKIHGASTAHAYIASHRIFDKFIYDVENYSFEETPVAVDDYLSAIFPNKYLVYPLACIQRGGFFSDISGRTIPEDTATGYIKMYKETFKR